MAKADHTFRANAAFITISTHERRPIFQISNIAQLFIETLLHYRTRGNYKLHAFLVMPDHAHLLLTPHFGPLEQTITLIQNNFDRRLGSGDPIWAPGMVAHPVHSLRDHESVRTYLHQTPVRANLTATPELYPYSSAHRAF
jgi:putative transposase